MLNLHNANQIGIKYLNAFEDLDFKVCLRRIWAPCTDHRTGNDQANCETGNNLAEFIRLITCPNGT